MHIVQSTDTCFAVPRLISVVWSNLDECNQKLYTPVIISDKRMWDSIGNQHMKETVKCAWGDGATREPCGATLREPWGRMGTQG